MNTRNKSTYQSRVIYIPAKRRKPIPDGQSAVVRIDSNAYNALVDIYNEIALPMSQITSLLICDAAKRVRLVKEDEEDETI